MTSPSATDKRTAKRRPGPPDKGDKVMDAAVQVFLANGFDQTTMHAVAAQAGVAKSTVYAHYADKFALFKAVVERSSRELAVRLDETRPREEQDPETRLTQLVLTVLEATTASRFLAFLRVMISEGARRPELVYAMDPAETVDVIGLIASTLTEEASRNDYELSDPRLFATLLLRIAVSSPQLDSLLFASFRPDRGLLETHARWITAIFLHGIEPKAGEARTVMPPEAGYSYPWLPELPGSE